MFGICQKRRRELQLGCGRAGHDARLRVQYMCYALASVLVVIAALQIYIKMNRGDDDVSKSIMMLVGACLFAIGAFFVFPAFFGYRV